MIDGEDATVPQGQPPQDPPINGAPWWAQVLVSLLFLGLGLAGTAWLIMSREAKERQPRRQAPPRLVDVQSAMVRQPTIELSALGQVKPARTVTLTAPVGGLVQAVHGQFQAGSQLPGNAAVVQLDQRDFELAVATHTSEVTLRRSDLALEQGLQQSRSVNLIYWRMKVMSLFGLKMRIWFCVSRNWLRLRLVSHKPKQLWPKPNSTSSVAPCVRLLQAS